MEPPGHVLPKLPIPQSRVSVKTLAPEPLASDPGETEPVLFTKNMSGSTHKSPPPPSMMVTPSKWAVTPSRSPTIPSPISLRRASALPRIPQDISSPVQPTVSSPTPQVSPSRRGSSPANAIIQSLADVSITSEGEPSIPVSNFPRILDSPSNVFPESGLFPKTPKPHSSISRAGNEIMEDIPSDYEGPNEDLSPTSGGSGNSAQANMQAWISPNISSPQALSIPNNSRSSPASDMTGSHISDPLFADLLRNIEEEEFGYMKSMVSGPPVSEQVVSSIAPVTPSTKRALLPASTSPVPNIDTVIPEPVLTPVKRLSSLVNTPGSHQGQWARKSTGTRAGTPSPKLTSGRRAHKTTPGV
ncbi:hypothetical protein BS47DRAFT_761637 [Hydnum rufescens UP504]|uniref:Uncharacterized protein n=1 Tax=Hydnum rufescens UP504 TaxID=1448309 RepID=A0A9P6BAE5_9AGAM|nr:hypothetical protein BS47DRAFT_761637 [Hydnum rufescens UP504]